MKKLLMSMLSIFLAFTLLSVPVLAEEMEEQVVAVGENAITYNQDGYTFLSFTPDETCVYFFQLPEDYWGSVKIFESEDIDEFDAPYLDKFSPTYLFEEGKTYKLRLESDWGDFSSLTIEKHKKHTLKKTTKNTTYGTSCETRIDNTCKCGSGTHLWVSVPLKALKVGTAAKPYIGWEVSWNQDSKEYQPYFENPFDYGLPSGTVAANKIASITYSNNTAPGTGKVKLTFKEPFSKAFSNLTKSFTIYNGSCTINKTSFAYTGKQISPVITVKKGTTVLKNGTDYFVWRPSSMKDIGTYKLTVEGSKYGFVKNFTVKIVPKGTSISSLTPGKGCFTVKWKKQATKTTGYQIRYSVNKSMSSSKSATVTKNTILSKKISKLKSKKKYYVQVRTYKTVSGTKYYSAWSAKKYTTTK